MTQQMFLIFAICCHKQLSKLSTAFDCMNVICFDVFLKHHVVQGVPKKLVRFAAKTTFINTISLIALQTAQVFLGHSVVLIGLITRSQPGLS